jgi:hypothetical protein
MHVRPRSEQRKQAPGSRRVVGVGQAPVVARLHNVDRRALLVVLDKYLIGTVV